MYSRWLLNSYYQAIAFATFSQALVCLTDFPEEKAPVSVLMIAGMVASLSV